MYLSIVVFPLIGCIFSGLFGRILSPKGSAIISITCVFSSLCLSLLCLFEVGFSRCPTYIKLYPWIDSELFDASWGFLFDSLTSSMCVTVTLISTLVHIYSTSYMSHDPHQSRFMSYLSLFTFSMLMLITADNLLQLVFGWEAVGLCSFLLINFWFTRLSANKAAIKAMVVNRIGDFALALGIFVIYNEFKTVDYSVLFSLVPYYTTKTIYFLQFEFDLITTICVLLFVGAMGKSAQLGLHSWLPDAMEGPTPVSALIHAATMVTAGVFLIIRCSILYEHSYFALYLLTLVGSMTAFFAAITGVLQNDLKKVIAYSTCSQLGYMIFACGLSNYSVSMFHLMNHAYFKALLFLSAGSVIHALADEQDMRKMGGLIKSIPFTYTMIVIGSLSLMGFPYLTGFYSKDLILELAYDRYYLAFAHWLGVFAALLTAAYSLRLVYLTFIANTNAKKEVFSHAHEGSWNLTLPLIVLALGSIFVGYLTKEIIWSFQITLSPIIPTSIKLMPVIFSLFGAGTAVILYHYSSRIFNTPTSPVGLAGYTFLYSAWQFNYIINHFLVQNVWRLGHLITFRVLDKGVLELIGPKGISQFMIRLTQEISNLQSGLVYNYALMILIAICALMVFQ